MHHESGVEYIQIATLWPDGPYSYRISFGCLSDFIPFHCSIMHGHGSRPSMPLRGKLRKEHKKKMDITKIPFNRFAGITHSPSGDGMLELELNDNMKNHLGTFHAAAQFSLAEACSGEALLRGFPQMVGSVVPLLRRSEVKFKRPAQSDIRARAFIDAAEKEEFLRQLATKGRANISISVEVLDRDDSVTMSGSFEWLVQDPSHGK